MLQFVSVLRKFNVVCLVILWDSLLNVVCRTFSYGRYRTEWLLSEVMMCYHNMPWLSVGLPPEFHWSKTTLEDKPQSRPIWRKTRKLCYRKDDRAMRPIVLHGCPENFLVSLTTPTATFPNIFHGLLFGSTLWMFLQNLTSVALPVPEIIGGTQKIGHSRIRPRSLFSEIFNKLLFGLSL